MKQDINLLFGLPYERVREDCHLIKDGNDDTMWKWAPIIAKRLPNKCLFIPVPGREGTAKQTASLVIKIQTEMMKTGKESKYFAVITGKPRRSLCEMKKAGYPIEDIDLGLKLVHKNTRSKLDNYISMGYTPILVDNVIDTGKTVRDCLKLLPNNTKVVVLGDTGAWRQENLLEKLADAHNHVKNIDSIGKLLDEINDLNKQEILYRIENWYTPQRETRYRIIRLSKANT